MKKILFFLLLILLSTLSFLTFHDKGNEILKPYVATYLEDKLAQDMSIELQHIKFDLDYIEFKAVLNKMTNIEAQGKLSLFSKTLDLDYQLKSDAFKNKKIHFDNKVDINGTIKGTFSDMDILGEAFTLKGNIKSDLATLKLSNTSYNIKTKELLANYIFSTPELSKLSFLSKKKLNGTLDVTGKLTLKDKVLNLIGTSNSLDGKIDFEYNKKKLHTYMQNISIAKFLHMLGEKPYATGNLTANVKLSDLKNRTGTFDLKTQNGKSIHPTLKKELNLDFGKAIPFTLNSKGNIASNIVNIQSTLESEIFNYSSSDMQHNLKSSKLSSTYTLDIPKLSKLKSLTAKSLKGQLIIHGTMNKDKKLLITGSTKSLGGNIDFKLQKKKLNAKITNVSVEKLMHLLSYPQVFKANIMGDFNYDLKTKQGQFNSKLNNAQLLSSKLTKLVRKIRGLDLTKERYNETNFNATLNKDVIDINFKAKGKKVQLSIPSGHINKTTNTIDATYNINIDNKDITGKIEGNISKPHITINSSKFIKDEIKNVIEGDMIDNQLKKLGLDKKESDKIKGFLGNLFK